MPEETNSTRAKALKINLDARKFGTFAEIGAGQEVARWFFHAGKAAGTVAKTISAYDMAISDGLYGTTQRYVSRERLVAMLDKEYYDLLGRLDRKRGEHTAFFAFADTSATQAHSRRPAGHSWQGVRFQTEPKSAPSEIIIHVEMLDPVTVAQQEALGTVGVNLIYGAFYYADDPQHLIGSLMDDLSRRRIEVDMIKFSGPAFAKVDNRLMSLQLVEEGLTDAVMFTAQGEVVQPSEVLYNKPVMIERGSFRPVTNVTLDMLGRAVEQLKKISQVDGETTAIMEMTLKNLMSESAIDHSDFLARVDILGALGKMVMISDYMRFDGVTSYLRRYTQNWIGMPVGVPTMREIFDAKYYTDLEGGILEGLGRLFQGRVKLFIYPTRGTEAAELVTGENLDVNPEMAHLYRYLFDNGLIECIHDAPPEDLHVTPGEVLDWIQSDGGDWEKLVPPQAAELIKQEGLFGYRSQVKTLS
ncbi:MAG TPA: hypothetical protein VMU80_13840 [Bryobacteraceae bacterium]|nr:hypothetical protein [Bryobacteraceae bacterium]